MSGLCELHKCCPCTGPLMAENLFEALVLPQDALDALVDMREYDVPYHMRFQIDTDVRCGHWFTVTAKVRDRSITNRPGGKAKPHSSIPCTILLTLAEATSNQSMHRASSSPH